MTTKLQQVTTGGAVLVDWELASTKMEPSALRHALKVNGFDPSVVPDLDQTARVKTAANRWTMGKGNQDRWRTEITQDLDEVYIQILRRGNAGTIGNSTAARRKFTEVATLVWDATNDQWLPDLYQPGLGADPAVQQAMEACRRQCDSFRLHYDCDFIRPVLIQSPLKAMGATPFIRRSGGTLMVPMTHFDELKRLKAFVGSIGDSRMGFVKADMGDADTVADVRHSAQVGLANSINKVRDELDEWRQRSKRLPTAAIGDRLSKFRQIRDRAQLYADSLGLATDDLLRDIAEAEADARDLLSVAMGKKPEPEPEPTPDAPTDVANRATHPDPRIGDGSAMTVPVAQ